MEFHPDKTEFWWKGTLLKKIVSSFCGWLIIYTKVAYQWQLYKNLTEIILKPTTKPTTH
jgi:hypothetical protein